MSTIWMRPGLDTRIRNRRTAWLLGIFALLYIAGVIVFIIVY